MDSGISKNESTVHGSAVKILIVDDYELLLRSMARSLREHDVATAPSASGALDTIRAGARFDAILCDVLMPEMNGLDLHRALLDLASDQAACMIFMSGKTEVVEAVKYLRTLPNALLTKPVDMVELRDALVALR
jgi:CheY-like chemotaxis protein